MSPPETPTVAAIDAAAMLQHLGPGPLAELRRMDPETGAPAFWRLAARHPDTIGQRGRQEQWMEIIRILAILTPKGERRRSVPAAGGNSEVHEPLHDPRRRFGAVLCDGGDPSWPGEGGTPRPVLSELRLAKLMAARGPQRAVLLKHAAQMILRSRQDIGVSVSDIALVLLRPADGRRLAEPYYLRLDRAEQAVRESEKGAIQ